LIADSELRRIAPLAGRISHQYRAKRRAELGAVQATRVSVFSRVALPPAMGSKPEAGRHLSVAGVASTRLACGWWRLD